MSIEQTVYCRVIGQGENLVLLHGWGVNSAVWEPVIEQLSQHFRLYLIDLPGFGKSKGLSEYTLQTIVDAIVAVLPERAAWCGWSLGGLVATYASYIYPDKVSKLIQVCSSVKFVAETSWPGVESSVFDNFKQAVQTDRDKTLGRFIGIQAMGCASGRKDASTLKKLLAGTEQAESKALLAGLELLNKSDLREKFSQLAVPCLSLFGQFDSLIPLQTGQEMGCLLAKSQQKTFKNSAHAPFISEVDAFNASVINFMID
ncbi:MAG: pimeloyl-[acyl-carrier protein] methyl ester esterase [Psychromonas sp.]|uniref:pimeloyl-ACP methyl ester esterase BioH n=1 Tax=Psychromonas sp. TaxID=1884585 RepID=UPI0039E36845